MARFEVLKVGKPFDIAALQKAPRAGRQPSQRDLEIDKLVNEVSAGAESQVWPLDIGNEKLATMRLAVNRSVKRLGAKVYVGVNQRSYPNMLLLSRKPLNKRQAPR
ncbi:MAG TPA: hypothetical protein VIV06_02040 [Candidatus Limnocylindrales bacterium]